MGGKYMDEYISRQAVLDAYNEEQRRNGPWRFETLIESVPAADVAPVVHGRRVKSRKHRWKKYDDGEIDFFAWDSGYCNGPQCLDCGESFCVHCAERDGGHEAVKKKLEEETCEEKEVCSICGRAVPKNAPYCNCGARMDGETK